MKRKVLAMLVPALLVAGAAIRLKFIIKMAIKLIFTARWLANTSGQILMIVNSENEDTSYARFGGKGETNHQRN